MRSEITGLQHHPSTPVNQGEYLSQLPLALPARNLGAYANIFQNPEIKGILAATLEMNFVDKAAYRQLTVMEQEVIRFLLDNLHAPGTAEGFATSGSSEAIALALAFHQRNFIASRPSLRGRQLNFVISAAYHKVFEKYALLFGAQLRPAPLQKDLAVDINAMERLIDDKTFCLVGIAGSTETGRVDDIPSIAALASKFDIPVHVDAAIGGYVFPFINESARAWDFAQNPVQTINVSGHKYGLCVPSIGFLLLRDGSVMPEDYRYHSSLAYLSGGEIDDFALTCSRNAAFVVNAHYNLKQFGAHGYAHLAEQNQKNKIYLAHKLGDISAVSRIVLGDTPVLNFTGPDIEKLSKYLARLGWVQHPHPLPGSKKQYIRVALRRHITRDLIDDMARDVTKFYSAK